MPSMKTIQYRGGVLTFRIPQHWLEEYAHDGGASFYADAPDAGTFRLSILTFEGQAPPGREVLMRAREGEPEPEMLPSGNALLSYRESATEDGEQLVVFYWKLMNAVAPRHVRIAIFSYTLLETQLAEPEVASELAMLTQEIRNARFAGTLGVLPV